MSTHPRRNLISSPVGVIQRRSAPVTQRALAQCALSLTPPLPFIKNPFPPFHSLAHFLPCHIFIARPMTLCEGSSWSCSSAA